MTSLKLDRSSSELDLLSLNWRSYKGNKPKPIAAFTMPRGYGESLVPGTPTIRCLRHKCGVTEPLNALTALVITYCALHTSPGVRAVRWARWYILFNGCASCFMHSVMPQEEDPYVLTVLANMDGTSMLGAVFAGLVALARIPGLPIETSLVPFLLVAVMDWTASSWFEVVFGLLWAVVILWTYVIIDDSELEEYALIVVGVLVAAACQIIDQQPLKKGEKLGWIRRNVPLHAVWHVGKSRS